MSGDDTGAGGKTELSFRDKAVLAVLAGLLALAGSYVGACRAGEESRETVRAAFEEQEKASAKRDERRARAVARTMIADLDATVLNLCQIGTRGSWYVTYVPLRSRISDEHRLLLARQRRRRLAGRSGRRHSTPGLGSSALLTATTPNSAAAATAATAGPR